MYTLLVFKTTCKRILFTGKNGIVLSTELQGMKYLPKEHGGYECINLSVNAVLTPKALFFFPLRHKLLGRKT